MMQLPVALMSTICGKYCANINNSVSFDIQKKRSCGISVMPAVNIVNICEIQPILLSIVIATLEHWYGVKKRILYWEPFVVASRIRRIRRII